MYSVRIVYVQCILNVICKYPHLPINTGEYILTNFILIHKFISISRI